MSKNPHDQSSAAKQTSVAIDERTAGVPAATERQLAEAVAAADELVRRQSLGIYRGWLKYLIFRACNDPVRIGPDSVEAKTAYRQLVDWTARIRSDPDLIRELRGVQEWAYESQADGSGQPFKINIPTDYDPANPPGLSLYCHGYSGNHLEHAAGMVPHPGRFEVSVLGRARGGHYQMLSERDVLDVLAYIKATWRIDENRVDICGGSMGGFASLWLASRHPDLFACVRPTCGWALQTTVENLLPVPVYSVHSRDDSVICVLRSRGPLQHLRDIGGCVAIDETTGYGHAAWEWQEGQARSEAWGLRQARPDPLAVSEIRYTAIDGAATGAWWAHVAEWGPKQAPAKFHLRLEPGNALSATLANVRRLRLDLAASPIDRTKPLSLAPDSGRAAPLPAPLPESVDLVAGDEGLAFEAPVASSVRLHTPGAAAMVYDGSPLLIVYGTGGDAATNAALLRAALAASKSPNPSWPTDEFQKAPQDGISHYQNLYGQLPIKADTQVTEVDISERNLVLIGTVSQNALARRLGAGFPVVEEADHLRTSDGYSYEKTCNAWALIHPNPLSPRRLILWIASAEANFYRAGAILPRQLFRHGYGADFVVMGQEGRLFAARAFDSRWRWSCDYARSPLLPDSASTKAGWAQLQADIMRSSTGSDFAVALLEHPSDWIPADSPMSAPGVTRYQDMALLNFQNRLFVVEAQGADLIRMRGSLGSKPAGMSPNFGQADIRAGRAYSVAIDSDSLPRFVELLDAIPQSIRWTAIQEAEAIAAFPFGGTVGDS